MYGAELQHDHKPTILIDARMVSKFEHGISRYVSALAEGLVARGLDTLSFQPVFILNSEEVGLRAKAPWSELDCVETSVSFLSWKEWFEIPKLIRETRAKAFHSPSFASFPILTIPYAQTVHDLIHLEYGSKFHLLYYSFLLKPFARKATVLASVSVSARDEVANWVGIPKSAVEVHPNTFDRPSEEPELLAKEAAFLDSMSLKPGGFYFAVANEKAHKNLEMLKAAHVEAVVAEPLLVAHEYLSKVDPNRERPYAFSALMRNARAVLSPSLVEGFGRVPIETLLMGTPVLLSDIPVHREILSGQPATESVVFVDPRSRSDWAAQIRTVSEKSLPRADRGLQDSLLATYSNSKLTDCVISAYLKLI